MKRSHIIVLCLSIAGWLFPVACYAQNQYELSCAAGSSDVEAPTYNPNTQKLRSWVCSDAIGHVSSPVFASIGGGVTSFNTRTGAVVPAANDYSFSMLSGILNASQVPTNGGLVTTFLNGTGTYTVPSGAVSSVFGRTGAVVAVSGDYTVAQVTGAAPLASPTFTGTVTIPSPLSIPSAGVTFTPASGTVANLLTSGSNTWNIADSGLDDITIGGGTTEIDAGSTVRLLASSTTCLVTTNGFDCGGASGITADNGGLTGHSLHVSGTKFTASGCSNSTTVGGATAGSYHSGATGTCTVTITFGNSETATNGWRCTADDQTTPANKQTQTSSTTTTAVITGTTVSGDVVVFGCMAY